MSFVIRLVIAVLLFFGTKYVAEKILGNSKDHRAIYAAVFVAALAFFLSSIFLPALLERFEKPKNQITYSTGITVATTEETTDVPPETEKDSSLTFTLIAGEKGEYGELVTYNEGTEFEETMYIYHVPAGTYAVTNKGNYPTQINVYSNETHLTEEGWEEAADGFAKQIALNETVTVSVGEDQHIEIHEPTKLQMRLISTDVPEMTVEP